MTHYSNLVHLPSGFHGWYWARQKLGVLSLCWSLAWMTGVQVVCLLMLSQAHEPQTELEVVRPGLKPARTPDASFVGSGLICYITMAPWHACLIDLISVYE